MQLDMAKAGLNCQICAGPCGAEDALDISRRNRLDDFPLPRDLLRALARHKILHAAIRRPSSR